MVYTYEWTWQWHVWRRFTEINTSDLIKRLEGKLKEKLKSQKGVVSIRSMATTITRKWHEWALGIYHSHVSGTTKTVFTSTEKAQSPAPFPVAIVAVAVIALIIVAIGAYAMVTVSSNVKEVVTKVPEVAEAIPTVAEAAKAVAENLPLILGLVVVAGVGYVAYREYQKRRRR